MIQKTATTRVPLLPALAERWSPRAFTAQLVEPEKLQAILEAARWAPSSLNEQPWHYLVAVKTDAEVYAKMLSCLVDANQAWAKLAPILSISLAKMTMNRNGSPNKYAFHDTGLSLMSLAVEATAQGLHVHPMGGILPDRIKDIFGLPADVEAVAGLAVGYMGEADLLEEPYRSRELTPRTRKELASFVFSGNWGTAADLG